jgi:hypothetical protein
LLVVVASFFVAVCDSWLVTADGVVVDDVVSVLTVLAVVLELVVLAEAELTDCADGVFEAFEFVLAVVGTTTPGLVVGIVTEFAAEADSAMADDDFATVVVVFAAVDGHNACTIPPFITIPNNVFELTDTVEQAPLTLLATDSSADSHADEQPLWKSAILQVGIWLSYAS